MTTEEKRTLKQEEELELMRDQGRKMGFLIKYSTLPEEVKMELVALIPQMSFEQIDRLLNIFEAKLLNEQTKDIDEKYQKEIADLLDNYKAKQKEIDENFINRVDEIINL